MDASRTAELRSLSDSIYYSVTLQSWTQNGPKEAWIVDDSGDSNRVDNEEDVAADPIPEET